MRTPTDVIKFDRENFQVELRKSKRNSQHKERRKILAEINNRYQCTEEEVLQAYLVYLCESFNTIYSSEIPLAIPDSPNFSENLKSIFPVIISCLDKCDISLMNCLTFLTFTTHSSKYIDILYDFKVHKALLNTLDECINNAYSHVLGILNNMCCDSSKVAEELIERGFLTQLSSIVYNDDTILEISATVLCNVYYSCKDGSQFIKDLVCKICRKAITAKGVIEPCLWVIEGLTEEINNQDKYDDFIPYILEALKNNNTLDISLKIVQNISSQQSSLSSSLLKAGLLDILMTIIERSALHKTRILFILSNVVAGDKLDVSIFLCHRIKNEVVSSMSDEALKIKIECSFILRNLLFTASEIQKISVISSEIFKKIEHVLEIDIDIDKNYLEFILEAIKTQELHKEAIELCECTGCYDKIYHLSQSSSLIIRELANEIINYF